MVLLPFFYLTGLYISLCFVLNDDQVGRVYGADLLGAGAGSALVLGLMNIVHPFALVPALLVPLALATWFAPAAGRWRPGLAGMAALVVCQTALLLGSQANSTRAWRTAAPRARAMVTPLNAKPTMTIEMTQ